MTFQTLGAVFLATALVAVPAPSRAAETAGKALPATKAPAATVQTLAGKTAQLSELVAGKPSMLIFWATWCPSCRQLIPSFKATHERFRKSALRIVAVNIGIRDSLETVREYAKENALPYDIVFDTNQEALTAYRVSGTPTVLLLDASGEIVSREHAVDLEAIEALLAGKPIPERSPPAAAPRGSFSR